MIKKIGTFALVILSFSAFAQTETQPAKRYSRPDIPGTFVLELGVNNAFDAKPSKFDIGFWGSRTINIYYQYDIRLFKSKFSLVPGIGVSLERFKFRNNYSLAYESDSDTLRISSPTDLGLPGIKKSQLVTNYIEIPIELRFSTRPDDPARSFKASIGGRIGYMYDAFTKVKYKEDGETKKFKNNQNYHLTRFRYGVFAKIGVGNVSLFTYYNLTPLFEEGNGAFDGNKLNKDFSTFTAGISLSSF